jgi:hypothetical protein
LRRAKYVCHNSAQGGHPWAKARFHVRAGVPLGRGDPSRCASGKPGRPLARRRTRRRQSYVERRRSFLDRPRTPCRAAAM